VVLQRREDTRLFLAMVGCAYVLVLYVWRVVHANRMHRAELRRRAPRGPCRLEICAVEVEAGHVYRTAHYDRTGVPQRRAAVPVAMDAVLAQLRSDGIAFHASRGGFDLIIPRGVFHAHVPDPARVSPEAWTIETTQPYLAIVLAHALVPTFGPLAVDFGDVGWLTIDRTRDVAELLRQLAARSRPDPPVVASVPALRPATPYAPYVIDDRHRARKR
jgi:hypothetical protein